MSTLLNKVRQIMPGATKAQCEEFLHEANHAITLHITDHKPAFERVQRRRDVLKGLATAGLKYQKALKAIDADTGAVLEQDFFNAARKNGAEGGPALKKAADAMTDLKKSGAVALAASAIAESLAKQKFGQSPSHFADNLFHDLAVAYGRAFGVRPTPLRTGAFVPLIKSVLKNAGIRAKIGEDRLKSIIKSSHLPGVLRRPGRPDKKK
jgi:hypothetical protein